MAGGYAGKVLMVELTTGTIREETPLEETYRQYIGGTGLGVRMLYERMKPRVDPLGPENMMGFVTGPLTATSVTGSVCHHHEKKQKRCFGVSGMGVKERRLETRKILAGRLRPPSNQASRDW
jgi:hypothetical protein